MESEVHLNEHNKQEYPPMHTAEHLLNGMMAREYGCGRAFTGHIERKKSKLDYHLPEALTPVQIQEIEDKMNDIISQDIPVTMEYITQEQAKSHFNMSRLPENASDTVRVVRVGEYDECLCAGTHVASTGEIGHFRISSTRFADGVFRIVFRLDEK